jgi:hypothetical protein
MAPYDPWQHPDPWSGNTAVEEAEIDLTQVYRGAGLLSEDQPFLLEASLKEKTRARMPVTMDIVFHLKLPPGSFLIMTGLSSSMTKIPWKKTALTLSVTLRHRPGIWT